MKHKIITLNFFFCEKEKLFLSMENKSNLREILSTIKT